MLQEIPPSKNVFPGNSKSAHNSSSWLDVSPILLLMHHFHKRTVLSNGLLGTERGVPEQLSFVIRLP